MVIFAVWLSLLTLCLYVVGLLVSWLGFEIARLPMMVLVAYLAGSAGLMFFKIKSKKKNKEAFHWPKLSWRIALLLAGAVFLTLVLTHFAWSQHFTATTLVLEKENAHDTFWHLALMASLDRSVPPENPVYAGEVLRGYHYFNDLLWVAVRQLTAISLVPLYLVVAPVILALFFVLSAWWLMKQLTKSDLVAAAGTVLLTIGSGLAFAVPLLFSQAVVQQSIFWLDQPTHYAFNQQLLLSLALVNVVLGELFTKSKKGIRWWVVAVILTALAGIKVYAVLVLIPAMLLAYGWWWVRGQERSALVGWLVGSIGTGLILLSAQGITGWPFIFFPGYFFKTMFEANDRLAFSTWELQRQVFAADNNYLRLVIHWAYAMVVFYVGNFGAKLFGLVLAVWLLIRRQLHFSPKLLLLMALLSGSWLAPALFIQKGVVWNTIQFMHFAQAALVVLLVVSWESWQVKRYSKVAALLLVILFALPTTIISVQQFARKPSFELDFSTLTNSRVLNAPENKTKPIIVDPQLGEMALVPAFAGRPVYFVDPTIIAILGLENSERQAQMLQPGYCPPGALRVYVNTHKEMLVSECELVVPQPVVPTDQK